MSIKKIQKPPKKLFSDSRLHPIFDKRIIKKIIQFNDVWYKFEGKLSEIKKAEIYYTFFLKKETKRIVTRLDEKVKFYNPNKSSKYFNEELWQFTKKRGVCEICNTQRKSLDKAHILKKSAYKNNRLKPKKAFKEYIHTVANIMLICNNCHTDMHKKHFSQSKINRIIKRRKAVNNRIIKFIQKDINFMKKVLHDLDSFEGEIDNLFDKSMRIFLRKRCGFKKKDIKMFIPD